MSILAAYMVPHPPMIVPDIGKGSEEEIKRTINAYEQVADEIAGLAPETIIISSPHAILYADYFHISPGKAVTGDFGNFRAKKLSSVEIPSTGGSGTMIYTITGMLLIWLAAMMLVSRKRRNRE